MPVSPGVKRLEILHPSQESINGDSGHGVVTTSDDHCLVFGVLNSAGSTVINPITRQINNLIPSYIVRCTYSISYLRLKPGSCLPSVLIREVVLQLSLSRPPMRYVPMSGSGVHET